MNTIRALPIRMPPIEGEALDSWLEALAHRTHTAFGDLLTAVGLNSEPRSGNSTWIVQLKSDEVAGIRAATGVDRGALEKMTLAHYSGRAVRIDSDAGTPTRNFPWGRVSGSRFCPMCLQQTGGRWQLAWRLGWTFACTVHRCLLADSCPRCGAVQRRRPHVGDIVPEVGHCAHPASNATGRSPARCNGELSATPVTEFNPDHPVLHAQRLVNAIIDCGTATYGVYRVMPQPRINALSDIRAVAGRALAYATAQDLQVVIPKDLLVAYREPSRRKELRSGVARTDAKPGLAAPGRAAAAAVGVIAALRALDSSDITSAGEALRWVVTSSRERGFAVNATNVGWGKETSPVLAGAQLAALGPMLKPSDQLRYRIGSPLPSRPAPGVTSAAALARRLPSMLWPGVALPFSIPNCRQRQLRPALSVALLLVNSRLTLDEATRLLDRPIQGHAVSRVLQILEKHDQWHSIRTALIRVAEYLAGREAPIDYRRRRRLDYTTLLPDDVWSQICRDTATPGPRVIRARIARCFIFERLSGLPARDAPAGIDDNAFRTKVADFPAYLTPELARALDDHAREFLANHGIDREAVLWRPPIGMFDGLDLPGPAPDAVDPTELHRIMAGDGATLGAAATLVGTSLDTVRYVLEIHPTPRPAPQPGRQVAPNHNQAYCTAKTALPHDRLTDLYHHQRMSLRDIAGTVGVSRQTIGRLARDYGIALREPGRPSAQQSGPGGLHGQSSGGDRHLGSAGTNRLQN